MIPCKDCITLAICNTIYLEHKKSEGNFIPTISQRCSIIHSYIAKRISHFEDSHIADLLNYFKDFNNHDH